MKLDFLNGRKFLYSVFVLAELFFVIQHLYGVSWDFMSYVLNAKHIFSGYGFFEWYRPPLVPFLIGMFSIFTFKASEFLYIVFAGFLHFYSSRKLAKKFCLNENYFYALSLSSFVLINGMNVGSELLALGLIQMFVAYLDKSFSGIFLGLSFLTRYNTIILLPLILFQKKIKSVLISFLLFIAAVTPWFAYNYFKTGNAMYSFVSSYGLNVAFRDYYFMNFDIAHLAVVMNFLIPFFVLGLFYSIKKFNKSDWLMLLAFALPVISYIKTPFKTPRYLFSLVLPTVYFAYKFIIRLKHKEILIFVIILANAASFLFVNPLYEIDDEGIYTEPLGYLGGCRLMSNAWVHINYLGREAEPYPWKELAERKVKEGNLILLYKNVLEPSYVNDREFLEGFHIVRETDSYIILGDTVGCLEKRPFIDNYLERYRENNQIIYNETIDISNCGILFDGNLADFCKSAKVI